MRNITDLCTRILGIAAVAVVMASAAVAQPYPPCSTTIAPDRPLLLFATPPVAVGGAEPAADHMTAIWADLPDLLRPYAVLELNVVGADASSRCDTMRAVVARLQSLDIPVALRLANDSGSALPLEPIQALLQEFSVVRGLEAAGLPFNEYIDFGAEPSLAWTAPARWLLDAIDLAARHGRFITLHLNEVHWLRIMANAQCRALYERIRQLRQYVVPINRNEPYHNFARMGALMGAWLEGAVDHWGVEIRSDWYRAARFIEPGVFGTSPKDSAPPVYPVRAMMLNAFMTGAEVYSFPLPDDLWYRGGTAAWQQAIFPTLERALQRGHIAAKDAVRDKIQVAYQMQAARNPEEFHLNLRDLDPVFDEGFMIRGVYGAERPGQIPELIPNTGRYFWIPILSPSASEATLRQFAEVVRPGRIASADDWRALVDAYYVAPASHAAFVATIADTTFVMNSRENLYEEQPFHLPDIAAPVESIRAERSDGGIALSWPLREGDVRYTVFRRALPDGVPVPIADDLGVARFVDASPLDAPTAYSVAALTNERTSYLGTVGLGEYLVFDRHLSPLTQEVVIQAGQPQASSAPLTPLAPPPENARAWWPNTAALPINDALDARLIAQQIEAWDDAIRNERLDAVMAVYSETYRDSGGWGHEYARRAFQWFFELCTACRMDRQIRAWDVSGRESGQVRVLASLRFEGIAISDSTGRFADRPVWFPLHPGGEVWLTWELDETAWKLTGSDPPLPNFREMLSFSAGPYTPLPLGHDR